MTWKSASMSQSDVGTSCPPRMDWLGFVVRSVIKVANACKIVTSIELDGTRSRQSKTNMWLGNSWWLLLSLPPNHWIFWVRPRHHAGRSGGSWYSWPCWCETLISDFWRGWTFVGIHDWSKIMLIMHHAISGDEKQRLTGTHRSTNLHSGLWFTSKKTDS